MNITDHSHSNIPSTPGVYFFKNKDDILYIGKATQLNQRTKSYFNKNLMETRGSLIVKMVEDAEKIEFRETESVLEALLLESFLIKKHQPPYNSKEKDNKSHNFVVITDEEFPRVFPVRKRQLDIMQGRQEKLLHVFGPFPQGKLLKEALTIMRKIFPFYTKKGRASYAHDFYHQLGLEPGGSGSVLSDTYKEHISYLALFFEGKKARIIKQLEKKMMRYAKNLEFEKAQVVKRQIHSLKHIRDIALLKRDFELGTEHQHIRIEAYDVAHHQGEHMVGVMVVYNGQEISHEDHRLFTIRSTMTANDTMALSETLSRRLKHEEWPYPKLIIADGGIAQKRALQKVLREHNVSIPVVSVVKDERHKPKGLLGQKKLIEKYKHEIIALNAESHRFAIAAHKKKRTKNFLE